MKVSETEEKIICPKCKGIGKIYHSERVSWDEDECWEEKCNYCNGKRIVMRKKTIEDFEVEDLNVNTEKIRM